MNILFRVSSIGTMMTEPKTKAEGPLSVGAKTYIRKLAAQEILGIDFEISSKAMEKGIQCEQIAIDLLNRVRGTSLIKNSERRDNGFITGECDLFDEERKRGHDIKCSWSAATFPILTIDCLDKLYEWQMRCYMMLWDAEEWSVDYCLVDTPDQLIGYEPLTMHSFGHIAEHHRVTSWVIQRDREKETLILEKVKHAREYFKQCMAEFDQTHPVALQIIAA